VSPSSSKVLYSRRNGEDQLRIVLSAIEEAREGGGGGGGEFDGRFGRVRLEGRRRRREL